MIVIEDSGLELIHYLAYQSERVGGVRCMDIVYNDKISKYVIRIEHSDTIEYWYFNLENINESNNRITSTLNSNVIFNTYRDAWEDDEVSGTFTSNKDTGISILDFHFHVGGIKEHFVLEWKSLSIQEEDSLHNYMRNRIPVLREEISLPFKQWENEEVSELANRLYEYPIGGWYFEGENNLGKYGYAFNFSPTGEVSFSYVLDKVYANGVFLADVQVMRTGTFEIENNQIKIFFKKLLGSRYDKPEPWCDPIEDQEIIILSVQFGARKLFIKQISGIPIFESNPEKEILEFKATILPPLYE